MKTWVIIQVMCLLAGSCFQPAHGASPAATSSNVTVLDFRVENSTANVGERAAGLEDFFEVALQKQDVPVLERRNIRLVLAERSLNSGLLSAGTLSQAGLPSVNYFISGSVAFPSTGEFDLTISIIRADKATVASTITKHGQYPDDWLRAIEALAKEVNQRLQLPKPERPQRSEFEAMTWLPEAVLPFFKGLNYFSRGDYAGAVPWFRASSAKDRHFDVARRWEARAYQKLNLLQLAEAMPVAGTNRVVASKSKRLVVAVAASNKIPAASRAAFLQALGKNDEFDLFDPGSIGATADELDLRLTGQMASSFDEDSVWLVVDDLIYLDAPDAETLVARQQNLLSGEVVRDAKITSGLLDADSGDTLARALLKNNSATIRSTTEMNHNMLPEPARNEPGEVALPKVLRLVQANPDSARLWVGLSAYYGDAQKTACLDAAIDAVKRQRQQPDASFWLASALWRKREMTRRIFYEPTAFRRAVNPLTNDFVPLLEWYPNSREAASLIEVTNHGEGSYLYTEPADRRYLGMVFTNPVVASVRLEADSSAPAASKPSPVNYSAPEHFARLKALLGQGRNAAAWQLANDLGRFGDKTTKVQVQPCINDLVLIAVRERGRFEEFTQASASGKTASVLSLGDELAACIDKRNRAEVIRRCAEIIGKQKGAVGRLSYEFTQAKSYRDDFLINPFTGNPGNEIEYQLLGGSTLIQPVGGGADYGYEPLMGIIAEQAHELPVTDLTREILTYIQSDPVSPKEKRLTAAFDLALLEQAKGNDYEALAQLKEILRQTEGTGLPLRRNNTWSTSIESAVFDALRKVRIYSGAEAAVCDCCGKVPAEPPQKPANYDTVNQKLARLWRQQIGELGTNLPPVSEQLLADKDNFFPVILYKLRAGEEVSHTLIFCSDLGTNALPALPVILQIIQRGEPFQDYNNALAALGALGRAAGCAKPLLILARENGDNGNFNYALRRIGPAPRRLMPQLAQLLHHKNPEVCKLAAKAAVETAGLDRKNFKNMTEEQQVAMIRKWWEETGISHSWND